MIDTLIAQRAVGQAMCATNQSVVLDVVDDF